VCLIFIDTHRYVYDATGELAAEYVTVAQSADCTTCYLITDPLGSTRVITDGNGNPVSRHDYYPFGEELATSNRTSALQYGATDYVAQRFTSKERDSETGLDYFDTRYFSSAQGRFTSPDDPLADQHARDPQSWNLYSYVRNNPLKYTDPSGQDCVYTNELSTNGTVGIERGDFCSQSGGTYYNGTIDVNSLTYNAVAGTLNFDYGRSEGNGVTVTNTTLGLNDPGLNGLAALNLAGRMSAPVTDPKNIAAFYGLSALGGLGLYASGALAGGELTTLGLSEEILTNQAAGGIIGWGTGQAGAGATRSLARGLTRAAVEEMKQKGLTKATVEQLLRTYQPAAVEAAQKGITNTQLQPRIELMQKILSLWK
jgi:RHS repeat-associated protein